MHTTRFDSSSATVWSSLFAGALQLFLQAGFICLLTYQFMRDKAFHWVARALQHKPGQQQQQLSNNGLQSHSTALVFEGFDPQTGQPSFTHVQGFNAASQLFLDPATGQLLVLNSPAATPPPSIFKQAHTDNAVHGYNHNHAAACHGHTSWLANNSSSVNGSPVTHSQPVRQAFNQIVHSLGRGLASISVSGSGGTGAVLRGVSSGGHASSGVNAAAGGARLPPGLIITSSSGGDTTDGSA
jgi:hypothetical protein